MSGKPMFKKYVTGIKQTLDAMSWDALEHLVNLLHNARISQRTVFVLGNGGSAATAQHLACDLNKNTRADALPSFRVISLCDNMAFFSAFSNDEGYENVFAGQLDNFVQTKDIVIAISASGNSANVLAAMKLAKEKGAYTVGWSGYDGGQLAQIVDFPIVVPSDCIEQIEDIHLMLEHMLTSALRAKTLETASVAVQSVSFRNNQPMTVVA